MGYPIDLALRYLGSKKRAFISVGTLFAILGVALGVAALATVMSVTGGFLKKVSDKGLCGYAAVLGFERPPAFFQYRQIIEQVREGPGSNRGAPFLIQSMFGSA